MSGAIKKGNVATEIGSLFKHRANCNSSINEIDKGNKLINEEISQPGTCTSKYLQTPSVYLKINFSYRQKSQ